MRVILSPMHAPQKSLPYGIYIIVSSSVMLALFYFWLQRRLAGEAFMLARNGQRVLRIMLKAAVSKLLSENESCAKGSWVLPSA